MFLGAVFLLAAFSNSVEAKITEYDIDIEYQQVNVTGKNVQAMTIGGTIPGKTIEATEGDVLRVTFHNKMDVDTSIHWHGILLPNDQDGVPYLTTPPIHAKSSFTYEYPVKQSGTYWYHSHTGLQEQRGLYGALIFHPQQKAYSFDKEYILVFSDWTNEDPHQVLRHLKSDGDYYSLKKGTTQSWWKILQRGPKAMKLRLKNSWTRMGPMDISDVGYDAFLVNGKREILFPEAKPGGKILLRLINASASTYFHIHYAGGLMQIVAADGLNVAPVDTGMLQIAVAETYDVIITLPESKSYELNAAANDGSGAASVFLGEGERQSAPRMPGPDLLTMDHSSHGSAHAHAGHGGGYENLKALKKTVLPEGHPWREVELRLTGNMERYIWSFNNKTLEEADKIRIHKGENVRFILKNETMMSHPIHLHGHFFRVVNSQGDYSPLKHTVDVAPFATTIIEFEADQEKDWLFHCHILYHMMTGMSRIVHYEGSTMDPKIAEMRKHHRVHEEHAHGYAWGEISAQSNLTEGFLKWSDDRNQLELEWDNNYTGEYDAEPKYLRNLSRFLDVFAGGEFERHEDGETENLGTLGFRYVLPMLITAEYRIDHRGGHELAFHAEIQLTDRLEAHGFYKIGFGLEDPWNYSHAELEQDYRAELEYRLNQTFSLIGNYDSDHQGGGGLRLRF